VEYSPQHKLRTEDNRAMAEVNFNFDISESETTWLKTKLSQ